MSRHRHVFDSAFGYAAGGSQTQALMCDCGAWAMPADGEWQAVPRDLLPGACAHLTRMRRANIWACGIVVAIAILVALLFV